MGYLGVWVKNNWPVFVLIGLLGAGYVRPLAFGTQRVTAGTASIHIECSELPPKMLRRIVREEIEVEITRLEVAKAALQDELDYARLHQP